MVAEGLISVEKEAYTIPINNDDGYVDMSFDFSNQEYVGAFSTIMKLLNTLLGAGLLGVPNSFTFCGYIPSLILLLVIAALSYTSTMLTVILQKRLKASSFESMAQQTLGKWGSRMYSLSGTLFCYASMTAYIIIGVDTVIDCLGLIGTRIVRGSSTHKLTTLIYSLLAPIALTIPTNLAFLSYFSTFSVVCVFVFIAFVVYKALVIFPSQGISPTVIASDLGMGIFNALGIYSLAFALAVVVIPVIAPADPDIPKRKRILAITFFMCFLITAIPGVLGYFLFGKDTKASILSEFPMDDILSIIVRAAYFVVVNASYPVIGLTVATTASKIIYKEDRAEELPGMKRVIVLFCVNIFPLLVSIFVPNVRPVLSIGGAFGGCIGNFCFPPLIWIACSGKKLTEKTNLLALAFFIFGVVSTCISTYESIVDAVKTLKH